MEFQQFTNQYDKRIFASRNVNNFDEFFDRYLSGKLLNWFPWKKLTDWLIGL